MPDRLNFYNSAVFNHEPLRHGFLYYDDFSAPLKDTLVRKLLDEFKLKKLLFLNQTHSSSIAIYPSIHGFKGADALITDKKNVGLFIRHADCQAAIIYDPIKRVIAAIHAGFKGQAQFIYTKCLQKMTQQYGCNPKDLKVALSASLGLCHSQFINYKTEFPSSLHTYYKEGYMDLKKMAYDELMECGVKNESIDIQTRCTFDERDMFFSYRRDKTTQRMASFISLL